MRRIVLLLAFLALVVIPTSSVLAQEDSPEVTISGTVLNRTTGEPGPRGLEVMLHGWGVDGQPLEMIHGEIGTDGNFQFEGVKLVPDAAYAAMVVYQDVTYFSPPAEDNLLAPIGISIYESTDSDSGVLIDQHHIFLDFRQGGLAVSEIYAITNDGDRAILNAVSLDDGRSGTLAFPLSVDAANIVFPMAPGDRFISRVGGFLDTRPLIPGKRSGQVVVSYVLPYDDELTIKQIAPYDTGKTSVFIPHGAGLNFENIDANYLGVETFADGNTYETYDLGSVGAGGEITLELSGRPASQPTGREAVNAPELSHEQSFALGLGALGVTLIAVGVWWWRRGGSSSDEFEESLELDEAGAT